MGDNLRMSLNVEKNYFKEFFLESSDYQNSGAANKIKSLSPQYSSTSVFF